MKWFRTLLPLLLILVLLRMGRWTRGLVVNRTGKTADVTTEEIEAFMSCSLGTMPILADIPEEPYHHGTFVYYRPKDSGKK